MNPTISFVIISWNSQEYIETCFNSIISKCENEKMPYEVIVIDNGSRDKTRMIIENFQERYASSFKKIFLPENHGTTYTRNIGLRKVLGEYICVLDSDTELLNGSIREVLEVLNARPNIGMIAPQLVLPDGSIQNSVKRFPSFLHKLTKMSGVIFGFRVSDRDFYDDFPFVNETSVDSAISACWFFKKDLIANVGFLDEKIFYSPEDLDFSLRVRLTGKEIMYYPHFKILHCTQQISHRDPLSKLAFSHFIGLLYYFKKHGGWMSTKATYKKINSRRRSS